MVSILPRSRPQLTRHQALVMLPPELDPAQTGRAVVLGIRGYYRDTMGKTGVNDRAIYDDAVCLIGAKHFSCWNFNTDPSAYRQGIATLKLGQWQYKQGIHGLSKPKSQQYQAYVQAAPVTVTRDGQGDDTGWFGINIHRGSSTGTSSLGCQTVPPIQWEAFRKTLNELVGKTAFRYILVDA